MHANNSTMMVVFLTNAVITAMTSSDQYKAMLDKSQESITFIVVFVYIKRNKTMRRVVFNNELKLVHVRS